MHKRQPEPEVVFSSDASGSWGCGPNSSNTQPQPDQVPQTLHVEAVSSHSTRLDICQLESIAEKICEASLAVSSSRTYKSAQRIYTDFCVACGRESLPALEQLLILFIAELSLRVCHLTASTYLAAIWHTYISLGHRDPLKGCPRLELY